MNWLADKIEQWPTAKLLPYARNARTHSVEQVAQIAASIAEFGFTNPILAGSDGIIVAGHGRLAAAQKLGLERVPVVVLDHLTPTQRRALVIADNRIAENAGWDDAMLRIELETLQLEGFDLDITGFNADALAELIAGDEPDNEGQTDEDAVPEVSETPISRPGDVWIMGQHRLLCGDSTVAESYDRLMQGAVADMVFTDPPYNVNYANSAKDKMRGKDRAILNDNLGDGFYDFLLAALTPTVAHCRGEVKHKFPFSDRDTDDLIFGLNNGEVTNFSLLADCGIRTLFSIMVKPKWSKTIGSLYMMTDLKARENTAVIGKVLDSARLKRLMGTSSGTTGSDTTITGDKNALLKYKSILAQEFGLFGRFSDRPSDLAAKMVEEMRGITSPRVRDEELKSLRMPF